MNMYVAELVGTMILIIFGGGVVANVSLKKSKAEGGGWIVVALAWGLAVTMGVYAVGKFSGAHLNPAVTLGMAAIGNFEWYKVPGYIAAQIGGGILGGVVVYFTFLPHWAETEDQATKLGVFSTDPAIAHTLGNILSEFIGTAVLLVGLLTIGANHFADGLNPLIVGFLIVAIGLSLGGPTGYAINPARDLGPRIAHFILPIKGKGGSNWKYAWIPIVGPIFGGIFGALFYKAVFLKEVTTFFYVWIVASILLFVVAHFAGSKGTQPVKHGEKIKN
ncbi:MIP family channel protein [Fictibacillus macauensis ZFHKF-1]|uniref:MIP family channel protein n=1 Tax=Fictibacillus macauensis ZFHKF-1 TaxID=1196324 RepID=I8ADZ7_9BACL|nr:MIP/aquaporin family protein [Fictibacillus macauensis]EIT83817.1 MIP family channel protein [Fictibacillus macauensis ZFHKF-1]